MQIDFDTEDNEEENGKTKFEFPAADPDGVSVAFVRKGGRLYRIDPAEIAKYPRDYVVKGDGLAEVDLDKRALRPYVAAILQQMGTDPSLRILKMVLMGVALVGVIALIAAVKPNSDKAVNDLKNEVSLLRNACVLQQKQTALTGSIFAK